MTDDGLPPSARSIGRRRLSTPHAWRSGTGPRRDAQPVRGSPTRLKGTETLDSASRDQFVLMDEA